MSAKVVGHEVLEQLPHARRFDLEDADGVGALQERERLGVVERELVGIELDTVGLAHVLRRRRR